MKATTISMKTFMIMCVVLVGIDSKSESDDTWNAFKQNFKTSFASKKEEAYRRGICERNIAKINKHNADADLGKHAYKMGVNRFCVLTEKEFKDQWLSGVKMPKGLSTATQADNETRSQRLSRQTSPASLDLRTTPGVGSIRDQGSCGSCWAFSAVAALEYAYWRKTGRSGDFSEQQLVDCVYGIAGGCQGGWMSTAFDYIKNQGLSLESKYPYTAQNGRCRSQSVPKSGWVNQQNPYVQVSSDDNSIKNALNKNGVLSVCVDASRWGTYVSGIYQDPSMSQTNPSCNHGVALVGYGTDPQNGIPYYIIRNSWNIWWGETGYMRMDARRYPNGNSYSGLLLNFALYPVM